MSEEWESEAQRGFTEWFDAEIHRTITFEAYPAEGEPVTITVAQSTDGYRAWAVSGDGRHAASNPHPTVEAAVCNLAAHAGR